MNKVNIKKAIAIMERAKMHEKSFYMCLWQEGSSHSEIAETEETLHTCGYTACFGGWVALSPEFHEDGGWLGECGEPCFKDEEDQYAIQAWLDIDQNTAANLCWVGGNRDADGNPFFPVTCGEQVTPQMVIDKLEMLLVT